MRLFIRKIAALLAVCIFLVVIMLNISLQGDRHDQAVSSTTAAARSDVQLTETERKPSVNLAAASYNISIDVNPSIELQVVDGLVIKAVAYNDDGESLLLDAAVIGLEAEAAVTAIVAGLIADGYINDSEIKPYLIVTVSNGGVEVGEETADALEKAAEDALAGQPVDCAVRTAYIPDDVAANAAAYGLSVGRYLVMDYIASAEASSIEETITKYDGFKIGELMELHEGIKDVFKDYNKSAVDEDGEDEEMAGLTPEQQVLFAAARDAFHAGIRAANDAFHSTFAAIKTDTKQLIEEARATYPKNEKEQYREKMGELRESMLAARRQAIVDMKAAIKAAQANFKTAIAALGLPDEEIEDDMEAVIAAEIDTTDQLDELLVSLNEDPAEMGAEKNEKPTSQKENEKGQGKKPKQGG